jgi:hypothetical protein
MDLLLQENESQGQYTDISYCMINSLKGTMSSCILRSMYFTHFHIHLRCGLTMWCGDPESKRIFILQKSVNNK